MTAKLKPLMACLLMAAALATTDAARAAAVTYTYTGQAFNLRNSSTQLDPIVFDPGFTYSDTDHISFSFTLASALAAGATTDLQLTSMTWTASDGKYHFGTTSQVGLFGFDIYDPTHPDSVLNAGFTTDAAGSIIGWDFSLFNGAHASTLYSRSRTMALGAQLGFADAFDYAYSRPGDTGYPYDAIEWGASTRAGSWVTTTTDTPNGVPEPGGLALLAAAGLGWAEARRRQRPR